MRRTQMLAARRAAEKAAAKNSDDSSILDIADYQYRKAHNFSEMTLVSSTGAQRSSYRGLRVIAGNRDSKDLRSESNVNQDPARQAIFQKLRANKQEQSATQRGKQQLARQTTKVQLSSPELSSPSSQGPKKKLLERRKLSKPKYSSELDQKSVEKAVKPETVEPAETEKSAPDNSAAKPKRTAAKRWGTLRTVTRVGGFYGEVSKRHRYIKLDTVMKRFHKSKKRLPKVQPVTVPTRTQRYTITVRMDPLLRRNLEKPSPPVSQTASEPSIGSCSRKKLPFMVPSHHRPNVSGTMAQNKQGPLQAIGKAGSVRDNIGTVDVEPKRNDFSIEEYRRKYRLPARTVFSDSQANRMANRAHKFKDQEKGKNEGTKKDQGKSSSRERGGQDGRYPLSDPPVTLNEAIASAIQGYDESEVILVISPSDGESLQDSTQLRITAVNCFEGRMLGGFEIPSDRIMTLQEEGLFARYFSISTTQTIEIFEKNLCSVLEYLADLGAISKKSRPPGICNPNWRSFGEACNKKTEIRPNQDDIFSQAKRDEMKIYVRPNFFKDKSCYYCHFFSVYGKYLHTYEYTPEEILKQMMKRPELVYSFEMVADAADIMFSKDSFAHRTMRIAESLMKTLGIVQIYDNFCEFLFTIYKKLF